jgi:hypothetical protein
MNYQARKALVLSFMLGLCAGSQAEPVREFTADYRAKYGAFQANAHRELRQDGENAYLMTSSIALTLLGKNLSSIHEQSSLEVTDANTSLRPLAYHYRQQGLGKRQRSIQFDWHLNQAIAAEGKHEAILPLAPGYTDNLTAYLEIARQLELGRKDIHYTGIEKGEVKAFHFQVEDEVVLPTPLGNINTIQLTKIRDEKSNRQTSLWLAPEWEYLLVKLVQSEPGEKRLQLELTSANIDGKPLQAD